VIRQLFILYWRLAIKKEHLKENDTS